MTRKARFVAGSNSRCRGPLPSPVAVNLKFESFRAKSNKFFAKIDRKFHAIFLSLAFLKIAHCRPLFLYFCLFNTVESKQMFNTNFAENCIRTADIWFQKRPLCRLSHNHCPFCHYLNRCLNWSVSAAW